eukprot:TRINITY_DN10962_c0_g1_i1.p1 TRINITY_DN10962_c0_g1~~TRINITY_DN10962_c0_g1_i1.p1  ORF type:complete len:205 (-),score=8.86 TRINITY_DN10962_c0_g1_i1:229-843(-)
MSCSGGVARIEMEDVSQAAALWCSFPSVFRGHRLNMRRDDKVPRPKPPPPQPKPPLVQACTTPIVQGDVQIASGRCERWVAADQPGMVPAGAKPDPNFNCRKSSLDFTETGENARPDPGVTLNPGEIPSGVGSVPGATLCYTRKEWLTSKLDLSLESTAPDYYSLNPGGVSPVKILQHSAQEQLLADGQLQGVPTGYAGCEILR